MSKFLLGIDIGGTKTAVLIGNEKFHITNRLEFPTKRNFKVFLNDLTCSISKIKNEHNIAAVGVVVGGPLDAEKGILYNPPHLGWGTINLLEELRKMFDVTVKIEHDAKAEALAEWKLGAGKGFKNIIFLTLGTGLGAGIVINGHLYRGSSNVAGEVGHIRIDEEGPFLYGKEGTWESYCSGEGIAKLAHFMFPSYFEQNISTPQVSSMANAGDLKAIEVLKVSGEHFGKGLALLFDILDPERIILGPLSWRLPNLWLKSALKVLEKEALLRKEVVSRVVKSALKEKVGDFAAIVIAHQSLSKGGNSLET
ncbi:ROK family protein [Mesoaciditoga lauensis]|uniref:ROK family protein n=1 Tax=Mesoaciditoga lauensis TaxID=1495039 RepID=UPI000569761D|nr:ROK family protein [Mesoaciditoga lauensis]